MKYFFYVWKIWSGILQPVHIYKYVNWTWYHLHCNCPLNERPGKKIYGSHWGNGYNVKRLSFRNSSQYACNWHYEVSPCFSDTVISSSCHWIHHLQFTWTIYNVCVIIVITPHQIIWGRRHLCYHVGSGDVLLKT